MLGKLLTGFPAHPNSSAAFASIVDKEHLNTGKFSIRSKVKEGELNQNRMERTEKLLEMPNTDIYSGLGPMTTSLLPTALFASPFYI